MQPNFENAEYQDIAQFGFIDVKRGLYFEDST
jgi:hypothetical protein